MLHKVKDASINATLSQLYSSEGRNIDARWQLARYAYDYFHNETSPGTAAEKRAHVIDTVGNYTKHETVPRIRLSDSAVKQLIRAWELFGETVTNGVAELYAPSTAYQHGRGDLGYAGIAASIAETNQRKTGAKVPETPKDPQGDGAETVETETPETPVTVSTLPESFANELARVASKPTKKGKVKQDPARENEALARIAALADSLDTPLYDILELAAELLEQAHG